MTINNTLGSYDLRFNTMSDQGNYVMWWTDAEKLISCIETNKYIYSIEISDHVSQAMLDKLKTLTKKRKPKKKKKGKKSKKKWSNVIQ